MEQSHIEQFRFVQGAEYRKPVLHVGTVEWHSAAQKTWGIITSSRSTALMDVVATETDHRHDALRIPTAFAFSCKQSYDAFSVFTPQLKSSLDCLH